VARSSFISEPTAARTLADAVLLGDLPASPFPALDGYNLTYLRPGATMGVVTTDDYKAPVVAFWHRGLGRIAALTAEVDGQYSRRLNAWSGFPGFAIGVARWLLGGAPPLGVQASIDRRGSEGIVRVELDPGRVRGGADDVRGGSATIVPPDARIDRATERRTLAWVDDNTLEARFPLQNAGLYLGAVQLGNGQVLTLSPLSLPYSPEFEPRSDPQQGVNTLHDIARITGGVERTAWDDVFSPARLRSRQVRDLVIPLALAVLLLHLVEIAGRRLQWFDVAAARLKTLRVPAIPRLRPRLRPEGAPAAASAPPTAAPEMAPRPPIAAGSALSRAKKKARGRMGH
jgi:hypothetical protein